MDLIKQITKEYEKSDIPAFGVGDTVKVHIKIKEGSRERIQIFEGYVLKIQGGGVSKTFTVRRIASGVGVEKTFPINSPKVEKIEVVKRGKVRRAKINYMRQRTGKSAKIKVATSAPKAVAEAVEAAPEVAETVDAAEVAAVEAVAAEAVAAVEAEAKAAEPAEEKAE